MKVNCHVRDRFNRQEIGLLKESLNFASKKTTGAWAMPKPKPKPVQVKEVSKPPPIPKREQDAIAPTRKEESVADSGTVDENRSNDLDPHQQPF